MTEQGENFLKEYGKNFSSSKIDEAIRTFRELSIEEQSEIWLGNKVSHWIFCNSGGGNQEKGVGIIDILNHKFPEGIKITSSVVDCDMPRKLYCELGSYEPYKDGKFGWVRLIEGSTIFKGKYGEIDRNKIVEYLSDPYVKFDSLYSYGVLFEHLDPDENRKRYNENYRRKVSV